MTRSPRVIGTLLLATCAVVGGCVSSASKDQGSDASSGGAADAGPSRASLVASNGYIATGPWQGYGFTATDPGAAMITPNCAAGCNPPFTGSDFCMQGTVTGRIDYSGFAMLGWNVNQAATAGAAMDTWPVPASGGITVTVVNNPSTTALRLQLQGTDPHSPSDRWCVPLVSGQMVAWTDFTTNCYAGGNPQTPLTAGTMIQQAAVLVPGLQTTFPFDVCLIDVQITP